jgi:hypothetical protein
MIKPNGGSLVSGYCDDGGESVGAHTWQTHDARTHQAPNDSRNTNAQRRSVLARCNCITNAKLRTAAGFRDQGLTLVALSTASTITEKWTSWEPSGGMHPLTAVQWSNTSQILLIDWS